MSITANMNLELPVVTTTLGPEWATELNAALELVDAHDHTSGKGARVPTSGININADLDFNEYKAKALKSTQFDPALVATLTGASNAGSLYVYSGNLYYTNGSGTAVQLTSGSAPVTTPGTFQTLETTSIAGDLIIGASDTFVLVNVDTSASRTVTLPAASAVTQGRVYCIKDFTGQSRTNPLSLAAAGADLIDGAASQSLNSNYGCIWVASDGVSKWAVI